MYADVQKRLSKEDPITLRDDILLEWIHACNKLNHPEEAHALFTQHRFVPCEGGESAVTSRYLETTYALACDLYKKEQYKEALCAFEHALHLPENLGAGLWNDGPMAPSLYGKARTLIHLGQTAQALAVYQQILAMKVDFFSDMHEPLLPIWQACALREQGKKVQADQLFTETCETFCQNKEKKDSGFFTTTPFFNCYIDPPASAREKHFTNLLQTAETIYKTAFVD